MVAFLGWANLLLLSPPQWWCSKKCGVAASAGPSRSWWRWCTSTRRRWSTSTARPACHWCGAQAAAGTKSWSVTLPRPLTSRCRYGTKSTAQRDFKGCSRSFWRNQNVRVKLKGKNVFCMCRGWMTESSRTPKRVNISKWSNPVCWSATVASCNFVYWSSELAFVPQLLKFRPSGSEKEYVEMTFVEHQTCECR